MTRVTQTGDKPANEIIIWEMILLENSIANKEDKKFHTFYETPVLIPNVIATCHSALFGTC
jgi:hypothetical protein